MLTGTALCLALITSVEAPPTPPPIASPAPGSPSAPAAPPGAPPAPRPRRIVSPELGPDGRVTFRLRAPRASEVLVRGLFFQDRLPLTRDASGDWSGTVGPVEPGLYEYSFSVDGLSIVDPANPHIQPARAPEVSILEVPATPPLVTAFQDVPHGTVHVHHYRASALEGRPRRIHVYTPPGYERAGGGRLPALYLLHGSGDNDATWSVYGRAPFILDNLLAQRKARPMVIVMTDGHPPRPPEPPAGDPRPDDTQRFLQELLADVVPLVERSYRVRTDAGGRAIAGLSMGGRQALAAGLNHPDRFAWVAAMSSSIPPADTIAGALADPAAINKKLRWLWIACGEADGGFQRNQAFATQLQEKGIHHVWRPSPGAHQWPVWRAYLAEIAPLLFAAKR
jgi:enterochelin esterase-like enzyme